MPSGVGKQACGFDKVNGWSNDKSDLRHGNQALHLNELPELLLTRAKISI